MNISVSFSEHASEYTPTFEENSKHIQIKASGVVVINDPNGSGGENGATFIPNVSEDGVISWTNDRGLENPQPVNISGKDGKDGVDGKDGYTPKKGVDYFDGKDGKNGVDGYTPIKGKDYFDGVDGKDGANGKDGCGIYRAYISYDFESQRAFIADSAPNGRSWQIGDLVIDSTDPTHSVYSIEAIERGLAYISPDGFSMKGESGADGKDGADGYTPKKGTDYWTPADKAEIVSDVLASLPIAEGVGF